MAKLEKSKPCDQIQLRNTQTGECLTVEQWALRGDKPLLLRTSLRRLASRLSVGQSGSYLGVIYERLAKDHKPGASFAERLASLEQRFAQLEKILFEQ